MNTPLSRMVVLGLGNILHSDDGVGARAVHDVIACSRDRLGPIDRSCSQRAVS